MIKFHSYYPELLQGRASKREINIYSDTEMLKLRNDLGVNPMAMIIEPKAILPEVHDYILEHYNDYLYVFTFDSELLELPNAKKLIFGTVSEWCEGEKTKMISMACSEKDFCEGHRNRQEVARKLKDQIDLYGKIDGGDYVDYSDIYANYRFNVAVENYSDGHYFTEKLCNCFASKTVPIYYGSPHIREYFNTHGMFILNKLSDIYPVIEVLRAHGECIYESMKDAIEDNYERVKAYASFNDTFYNMYGDWLEEI